MTDDIPTTIERWLPIPGYEGWYEVSDWGRVKSLQRKRGFNFSKKIRMMSPACTGRYMAIILTGPKAPKQFRVHALVMLAFVGPYPPKEEINHIDFNPKNNRLDNLEYVTKSQNILHSLKRTNAARPRGESHYRSRVNEKQVIKIREMISLGVPRKIIAHQFGIGLAGIRCIRTRRSWNHI